MDNKEQDNKEKQPLNEQELEEVNGGIYGLYRCRWCKAWFSSKVAQEVHMKQNHWFA